MSAILIFAILFFMFIVIALGAAGVAAVLLYKPKEKSQSGTSPSPSPSPSPIVVKGNIGCSCDNYCSKNWNQQLPWDWNGAKCAGPVTYKGYTYNCSEKPPFKLPGTKDFVSWPCKCEKTGTGWERVCNTNCNDSNKPCTKDSDCKCHNSPPGASTTKSDKGLKCVSGKCMYPS